MKFNHFNCLLIASLVGVVILLGCSAGLGERAEGQVGVRGIAYGRPVSLRRYPQYGAILAMQFPGNGGLCSATHLSGHYILTAWHCVGGPKELNGGKNSPFTLISPKGPTVIRLNSDDYEIHLPPSSLSEEMLVSGGRRLNVPLPDIALVEVTRTDLKRRLEELPLVELPPATLGVDEPQLFISGYGKDAIDAPAQNGRLITGRVKVSRIQNLFYELAWEVEGEYALALEGDSGGPLHKWSSDGTLQLYGVLSSGRIESFDTERGTNYARTHSNRVMRLDVREVREWLLRVLSR